MKKFVIVFALFITTIHTTAMKAQVTQEWVATYNGVGTGSNAPKKCLIDKFGNIIIAGRSENSFFNDDFITLKYNSSGNLLWERRYNGVGNGNDAISGVVLDDSNNIYVTGYSQEGAALGGYNWVTIKYFSNGDTAWKKSFNWIANGLDEPFAMTIDKLRNIYVAGYGRTAQPIDDDFITVKYNSNGELLWTKSYDSQISGPDRALSIALDDSANVYSTGYSASSKGNDLITIKYNTIGNEKWVRKNITFNGDYLRPAHVVTDKNNDIIVNGYYYIGDNYAFNTIKYSSSGDLIWKRIYKGDGNLNFCFALCTDDSANVYAAGRSTNTGTGEDFVTIKYYANGDTAWIRNYDGGYDNFDEIRSIAIDSFHNVYVTGLTGSSNGSPNYTTIKYDENGLIKWLKEFRGSYLDDISTTLCLDLNKNVIVSGYTQTSLNNYSIGTIKYSQLTGVTETFYLNDPNFKLYQNYPNPFNPKTAINYYLSSESYVKIKIYNSLGKEIKTLTDNKENDGNHSLNFEGNDLPSGIYLYSLIVNGNLIDTKRMLLIK
ncbi:MAG: SBBP repeat-containing protein [Ignavibacteria bacterium]